MLLVELMTGLQTRDSYIGNSDLVPTLDGGLSAHSRTFRLGAGEGNVVDGLGAPGNQFGPSVGGFANPVEIWSNDVVNGIVLHTTEVLFSPVCVLRAVMP